jgi:hypothetical protein
MSTPTMRDRDIRTSLHGELARAHRHYASETLFIDELGLCQGNARIDLAVVNGSLSGYEIKSERDTLQRLPHQVEVYSRALDYVTIVASESHIVKTIDLIPEWWGVLATRSQQGDISFRLVRQPQSNPSVDPYSVAQLLWRPEVVTILGDLGVKKGVTGKSRRVLWQALAETLPIDELRDRVRHTLKVRERWRSELPPSLHDGSFRSSAISSRFPVQSMD